MSRIFLSHSSADERAAVALRHWLSTQGWDDVFLDVDPQRGLVAGERWQLALRQAADRCEVVLCIVSAAWAQSKWCLAEFLLAKTLNKRIFGALLEDIAPDQLPLELTAEWQLCRLVGQGQGESVRFDYREGPDQFHFLASGLQRLRDGLLRAGLDAGYFAWPPKEDPQRAPYRGLEPLEAIDAAVFFGRDVEILRALDALRGMRASLDKRLFVILGASGAGKSSFLRAGLLPRLGRDDRHFLALPPLRPDRAPVSGERGLARVLRQAQQEARLPTVAPAYLAAELLAPEGPAQLRTLLRQLQEAASRQLVEPGQDAARPTVVLPVDQAEELFSTDAGPEAPALLGLLGALLGAGPMPVGTAAAAESAFPLIVALTIRSDRYEPLQTAPQLAGLQGVVFDGLKPMPPTRFREVIAGPAQRASAAGAALSVQPALVDQLVEECSQGGDTLPLLGLTLARLYRDRGQRGEMTLDDYRAMGGLASIVETEAESVLDAEPGTRSRQIELLHAAFVPWLAAINPSNDQPMRRVARLADLTPDSHALVRALAERRLLLIDRRDAETVVEVAHEALLRQWQRLAGWLADERDELKDADVLERAAQAWQRSGRKDAWLMEGERLAIAELLADRRSFARRLEGCREFLRASRQREDARRADEQRRKDAELEAARALAAEQQQRAELQARAREQAEAAARRLRAGQRRLFVALLLVLAVAVFAVVQSRQALQAEQRAGEASVRANALRLAAEARAMLAGALAGGDERALQQLVVAARIAPGAIDRDLLDVLKGGEWLKLPTQGQDERAHAVAISPDGALVVAGNEEGTVELWDARSARALAFAGQEHGGAVNCIAFRGDGQGFATGGSDGELRLWSTSGQRKGDPLKGHRGAINAVAFSIDGQQLLSGGDDGTVRLWDAATGKALGPPLTGHAGAVLAVGFSPEGQPLSAGGDGTLRRWDLRARVAAVLPLERLSGRPTSMALHPAVTSLVAGMDDGALRMWDASNGHELLDPLRGHRGDVRSVAFSADGRRIVSGGDDRRVRVWAADSGALIGAPLEGHAFAVRGVALSRDGSLAVSVAGGEPARVWHATGEQALGVPLRAQDHRVTSLSFSPDGTRIVEGNLRNELRLWNAATGQPLDQLPMRGHMYWVSGVAFARDGKRIASSSYDGTLRVWDAATGMPAGGAMSTELGANVHVNGVAWRPDGRRLAAAYGDGSVRQWDAETHQPVGEPMRGHRRSVESVAYSPDGKLLASGGVDKTVRLWDAQGGKLLAEPLAGHEGAVTVVAFSPDGARLLSGGRDRMLRLWDVRTHQMLATLEGHLAGVSSAAFSPDGRIIVSASGDALDSTVRGTVLDESDANLRLWDGLSGAPIGSLLQVHSGETWSVAFSPDGKRIASAGPTGPPYLWPAPGGWPEQMCRRLSRNPSRAQWTEWVGTAAYQCPCAGLPIAPDEAASGAAATERCPAEVAGPLLR